MHTTPVNPCPWSLAYGFSQAQLVERHTRELFCSGQTSVDRDGHPQHPGDVAAQIGLAMDNLEAVLAASGMDLSNVVRLAVYARDVDAVLEHGAAYRGRLAAAGVAPAITLLGVQRLVYPELLVELEATAVA